MTSKKILATLCCLVVALTFCTPAWASTLSLTPENSTVSNGDSFTATLTVDTQGDQINAVDISISYPKDILRVNSVDQGSDFKTVADKSYNDGLIHLSAVTLDPNSGDLTVAEGKVTVMTINLTAIGGGTANLSISPDSAVVSQSSNTSNLSGIQNASFTITSQSPTPAPTNNSASTTTSNTSSSTASNNQQTSVTSNSNCVNEDRIKSSLKLITSAGSVYDKKMDKISSLVGSFYDDRLVPLGKTTATFSGMENRSVAKSQAVQGAIAKLAKDTDSFSCKTGNYQQLKAEYAMVKSALLDYQKSIREMIQVGLTL